MIGRTIIILILLLCYCSRGTFCQEEKPVTTGNAHAEPSMIDTVLHGTIIGAYSGFSIGWLRYAGEHQMQSVWESAGYGALIGTGMGFLVSRIEGDGDDNRILSLIDETGVWGVFFGFMFGSIRAIGTSDSKNIGNGIAIGYIVGTALGIGGAGYETIASEYVQNSKSNAHYNINTAKDSRGNSFAMLMLQQQFE